MLESLTVKNYAIIKSLNVDFTEGLNVLTGETGAGKSIIVGALSLALGARANTQAIRVGAEKTSVSAVFYLQRMSENLRSLLTDLDIECEDDTIVLRREVNTAGRNVCRVNDCAVSVSALKQIGELLVDIHGQHEHQRLLSSDTHLSYLDAFAHNEITEPAALVRECFARLRGARNEYKKLLEQSQSVNERQNDYELRLSEIEAVDPAPDEDEQLEERIRLLSNSEKLYELIDKAYVKVYSASANACDLLADASGSIETACAIDPSLSEALSMLSDALINAQEVSGTLRDYRSNIEFEPEELDKLHARLSKINSLKRKYGEIAQIRARAEEYRDFLARIENIDYELKEAKLAVDQCTEEYLQAAGELSALRKSAAAEFEERMVSELRELAMADAQFSVSFTDLSETKKYTADGIDEVEFLISTNKGTPLSPLAKTASGGEISRIMLSLKNMCADADEVETLVFDEIDTGISGRTAQVVAQKMADLSHSHQILSISHLAQIASMADTHFLIAKSSSGDETETRLLALGENERVEELARINSGASLTETTRKHAEEMLAMAKIYKQSR